MATLLEAYKKRKRNPKIYGLHTFAHPGCPIAPSGPFRDNIRVFLQQCSEPEAYNIDGMPVWCTFLVHEDRGFMVPLYTIEESVKHSLTPFCDHCRCTGWSHHFVSKRKYHMIIPVDDDWNKPLEEGVLDMQTHLLHGLIHCNGFGHLISINGIEGGSKYLCGRQIMDLWDRICTNLHARKITVEDVSKKRSMDLRLLHGVAYGHPWFGRWGYRFCNGSFGVTQLRYEKAVEIVSLLELDEITQDFTTAALYRDFKRIICYYRDLSETKLVTIRDLIRFMLTLKSRVPFQRKLANLTSTASSSACSKAVTKSFGKQKPVKCSRFSDVAVKGSRWPVRRLEYVADVVVDALREKKLTNKGVNCMMTRQEVRDAARLQIGDTGLIDYVLKSMKNVVVGGLIVRHNVNKSTRISEFTIEELGNDSRVDSPEQETEVLHKPVPPPAFLPGIDVYKDVHFLYRNVLMGYRSSEQIGLAAQTVLDTKIFVKEWPFKDEDDELLRFICHVVSKFRDLESDFYRREFSHGELIVLPLHSTYGDLKAEVENAMRDTYCATENFVVTDIEGLEGTEDSEVLFGLVESGSEIRAKGFGIDSGLMYESGVENWTVRCRCGARDDDGERMVACDICEIWQHTRCCGIEDSEVVPPLFVCVGCCDSLVPSVAGSSLVCDGFGVESSAGLWEL
ncbi:hypothetical protein Vadar_016836 [Vaccinium darrowii]|uniref:Uncharacterized protein n=1 Tax=Vaccinium darrowii TaxID=229202 RepID=A0ACB7Y8C4_9ERIC|nr:hypothetical protein Vadar_016836 [Vaccinium darrowii]